MYYTILCTRIHLWYAISIYVYCIFVIIHLEPSSALNKPVKEGKKELNKIDVLMMNKNLRGPMDFSVIHNLSFFYALLSVLPYLFCGRKRCKVYKTICLFLKKMHISTYKAMDIIYKTYNVYNILEHHHGS